MGRMDHPHVLWVGVMHATSFGSNREKRSVDSSTRERPVRKVAGKREHPNYHFSFLFSLYYFLSYINLRHLTLTCSALVAY